MKTRKLFLTSESQLKYGLKHNSYQDVEESLKRGADVNANIKLVNDGHKEVTTPLFYAILFTSLDIVALLLKYKADVNSPLQNGYFHSIRYYDNSIDKQQALFNLLLNAGLKLRKDMFDDCIYILYKFITTDSKAAIKTIKSCVKAGFKLDPAKKTINSLLHVAITAHQVEVVKYLLAEKDVKEWNYEGHFLTQYKRSGECNYQTTTPLLTAISVKDKQCIEVLLKAGIDVNVGGDCKKHGCDTFLARNTPLLAAIKRNDVPLTKLLIGSGADVNKGNKNGEFPLMCAIINDTVDDGPVNNDIVDLLLDAGAHPDQRLYYNELPLEAAIRLGDYRLFQALLAHHADINALTANGSTLLTYAIAEKGRASDSANGIAEIFACNNAIREFIRQARIDRSATVHSSSVTEALQNNFYQQNTSDKQTQNTALKIFSHQPSSSLWPTLSEGSNATTAVDDDLVYIQVAASRQGSKTP